MVVDDVFPHSGSPFRYTEFTTYLQEFGRWAAVLTSGASVVLLGDDSIAQTMTKFKRANPALVDRVALIEPALRVRARLAYFVFLLNAWRYIDQIDRAGLPFVFTLYPGGGFRLNDPDSDAMLRRVTSSANFRHVIVTQRITRDYLLAKGLCDASQITEIFGLVLPDFAGGELSSFAHFGVDKPTLDIAFVAHKYTSDGRDKGYGTFIESARLVAQNVEHARFHVVGGFDATDVDVEDLADRITFHGRLEVNALRTLFDAVDIVVAPTVPNHLGHGSFDGFPTGACVEAGLHETVILCTDQLGQNGPFVDGEDIFIIEPDAAETAQRIIALGAEPEAMRAVAVACRRKMLDLYSTQTQMGPRLDVLRRELGRSEARKSVVLEPREMPVAKRVKRSRSIRALARMRRHR